MPGKIKIPSMNFNLKFKIHNKVGYQREFLRKLFFKSVYFNFKSSV